MAENIPFTRYQNYQKSIDWSCRPFGLKKHLIVPSDSGAILHVRSAYNGSMVLLGSAHEGDDFGQLNFSPLELEGQNTASIYVIVDDADARYKTAIENGAEIVLDLKDEDYGGRGYTCKGLEGHLWNFGTYNPWK